MSKGRNRSKIANIVPNVRDTVLVLIKLTKMRFRCGFVAVPINWNFVVLPSFFLRYLRTLYIVLSLVRRRVSPGSKLCTMFLNIAKYFKTVRCGCVYFFNLLKTSSVKCIDQIQNNFDPDETPRYSESHLDPFSSSVNLKMYKLLEFFRYVDHGRKTMKGQI